MKNERYVFLFAIVIVSLLLLSSCGFILRDEDVHSESERIVLTTIAVVNSDMGIEIDGERVNYSAAIIETLDANFTLVSPAMAESGFEGGAFGAVITFPSDVSEHIVSFNAHNPQRVQLEFRINPQLAEADYISLHRQIMDLQVSINTTLAQTYVSSILSQFHAAQGHAYAIFYNNYANLDAVEIVRLPAFTSTLELEELPENPLEITPKDAIQFIEDVDEFAERVAALFRDSYAAASESYLAMREGLFDLIEGLPGEEEYWMVQLQEWVAEIEEYSGNVSEYAEIVEDYADELIEWHEAMENWHYEADSWYDEHRTLFDDAVDYIEELREYAASLHEDIEYASERLQAIYDDLWSSANMLQDWNDELDTANSMILRYLSYYDNSRSITLLHEWYEGLYDAMSVLQDWYYELREAAAQLVYLDSYITIPPINNFNVPRVGSDFNYVIINFTAPDLYLDFTKPDYLIDLHVPTAYDLLYDFPQGELPDLPGCHGMEEPPHIEIIPLSEIAPEQIYIDAPPRPEDFFASIESLHDQLAEFEVDEFLGDDIDSHVDGMLSTYEDFLERISEDLDIQFEINTHELIMVRYGYIDHLSELRFETLRGEVYEQERLREYLARFIEINEQNNSDTHSLLSGFSRMMPESRTPAGLNHSLVEFTVAPFEFVPPDIRQATGTPHFMQQQVSNYAQIVVTAFAIGLFIIAISLMVVFYFYRRKRAHRNNR